MNVKKKSTFPLKIPFPPNSHWDLRGYSFMPHLSATAMFGEGVGHPSLPKATSLSASDTTNLTSAHVHSTHGSLPSSPFCFHL